MVLVGSLLYLNSCGGSPQDPTEYPGALVVHQDAAKVRYHRGVGYSQVSYVLREEYPALQSIRTLTSRIQEQGFKLLSYDPLNPQHEHPNIGRWTQFQDATGSTLRWVNQWMAWYEDSDGSSLLLAFRYANPTRTPRTSDELEVYLHYQSWWTRKIGKLTRKVWESFGS